MKLKVTYLDGDVVEVNAGPRAEVALERQYDVSVVQAYDYKGGTGRVEYIYYLGWAALHFGGQEPKDFEDFLARIADVEAIDDPAAPDPTPPGQDTDDSSG